MNGTMIHLGVNGGGVHPLPGTSGSPWPTGTLKDLSVEELKTFVQFGSMSALMMNSMAPIINRLMDSTQNGEGLVAVANSAPNISAEDRAQIKIAAAAMARAVENALPAMRKNIPQAFNQLDQAAEILAHKSGFTVQFWGPVYYQDEMRTGVLSSERKPVVEPVGTLDYRYYSKYSPGENAKSMLAMYPRVKAILEFLDPDLRGQLGDPGDLSSFKLGSVSLDGLPVLAALLALIAKHVNLTVVLSIALSTIIVAAVAFAAIAVVVIAVAMIVGAALPPLEKAFREIAPPLLSGVQWIMIFAGLGLGIGLIFAGPTLVNRLEYMFRGAVETARVGGGGGGGRGRDVEPPPGRGGGSPAKADIPF